MDVTLDFETRSAASIDSGPHRYAQDPSTEVLILGWMYDDMSDMMGVWLRDDPPPTQLLRAVRDEDCIFHAYNAQFEIAIWKHVMCVRHGWPDPPPLHRWRDTMAEVAIAGYPMALDKASALLGTELKDAAGKKLIKLFSVPNKHGNFNEPNDYPEQFLEFISYCRQDVLAERAIHKKLAWVKSASEQDVWELVVKMNQRGLPIDKFLVEVVAAQLEINSLYLQEKISALTEDRVTKPTQVARIIAELKRYGLDLPNLTAETVAELDPIPTSIPLEVAELLSFRKLGCKSSTAKFKRILELICADGTVKDNLRYYGAGPGRMSGAGFQPQNLPRYKHKDPEPVIESFKTADPQILRLMFNVEEAASGLIRPSILAPPSKRICSNDFSGVEACGVCWLCGEKDLIDKINAGLDMYKVQASQMFGVGYAAVTPLQRQVGKILVLACLDKDTEVLTDVGLVPIEHVCTCMRVWDGVEWVNHSGAVYQGHKEVMGYGELLATPDHKVFTEERGKIELREAARCGATIIKTGFGRRPIWEGDGNTPRYENTERKERNFLPVPIVRRGEVDQPTESATWDNWRMPTVQPAEVSSNLVAEEMSGHEREMPNSDTCTVSQLWSEEYRVSIRDSSRCVVVDNGESRPSTGAGDRPYQQRRPLRAGESSVGGEEIELLEQEKFEGDTLSSIQGEVSRCPLCGQHLKELDIARADRRGDCGTVGETELQTERQVWDILNAGPRSRFTANGKLVSNCGYAGGFVVFVNQAKLYKLPVTESEAKNYVRLFRQSRPRLTSAWKEFENAALLAMTNPGDIFQAGDMPIAFQLIRGFLKMTLPSGRGIYYPAARLARNANKYDGRDQMVILSGWVNSQTHQWTDRVLSGPLLFQNAIQGLCRDLLIGAQLRLESSGYTQIGSVHDEAISLLDEAQRDDLPLIQGIMNQLPPWAKGFPLKSSGYVGKRYKKD